MILTKEQYLQYLEEEAKFYGDGYKELEKLINNYFELLDGFERLENRYSCLYMNYIELMDKIRQDCNEKLKEVGNERIKVEYEISVLKANMKK